MPWRREYWILLTARLSRAWYLARGHYAPATLAPAHERSCTMTGLTRPEFGGLAHAAALASAIGLTMWTLRCEARTVLDTSADLTRMTFTVDRVGAHTPAAPTTSSSHWERNACDERANARRRTVPHREDRGQRTFAPFSTLGSERAWSGSPQMRGFRARQRPTPNERVARSATLGRRADRLLSPTSRIPRHRPTSPQRNGSNPHATDGLPLLRAEQRKLVGRLCR